MPYTSKSDLTTLGIHKIKPVDLSDPAIRSALEQTMKALSNPRLRDIMALRTGIQQYLCRYLSLRGYVHPPVYMLTGCTDPLNHWTYPARINYYGEETSLTQSLILQKILIVMLSSADKVFWASPNIRMETRVGHKNYKYATEFMQIDFERRSGKYEEMLSLISSTVCGLYRHINEEHAEIITRVRGEMLPDLPDPLPVYDMNEILHKIGTNDCEEAERHLCCRSNGKPFMVVNIKREAYDCYDGDSNRYLNYDVIVPPFNKNPHPVECLSGGERTRSLNDLAERMKVLGYPMSYFAPFFELFDSCSEGNGRISCAGAGFGVERLTYALMGLSDIHEVYPFPRFAEGRIVL